MTEEKKKKPRGFAAMDPAKVAEIASKGGKASHAAGTAHQFTKEEAQAAGKKGGAAYHAKRGGPRKRIVPAEEITPEKGLRAEDYVNGPANPHS